MTSQRQKRTSKANTTRSLAMKKWTWYKKITRAVILPHSNSGHDPNFCVSDTSQGPWTNNWSDLSTLTSYFTNKSVFVYRKYHSLRFINSFEFPYSFVKNMAKTSLAYESWFHVCLPLPPISIHGLFFKLLLIILVWSVITVRHGNTRASLPHFQKAMIIFSRLSPSGAAGVPEG